MTVTLTEKGTGSKPVNLTEAWPELALNEAWPLYLSVSLKGLWCLYRSHTEGCIAFNQHTGRGMPMY